MAMRNTATLLVKVFNLILSELCTILVIMHFSMYGFLFIVCCVLSSVFCAKIPSQFQKCKPGDSNCLKAIINEILKNNNKGIPELNLVPLDPLVINSIDISQGKESPVNINLKFRKSDLSGISSLTVQNIKGFGEDIKGPHVISLSGPYLTLAGQYAVEGRILLLPINGAGNINITLIKPDLKVKFYGKPVEKNGKIHINVDDLKLEGKIGRMHINMENLFNGDKALGDNMNAFLNENWQDIFIELKEKMFEAFALILQRVANNVFEKFPYEDLYSS